MQVGSQQFGDKVTNGRREHKVRWRGRGGRVVVSSPTDMSSRGEMKMSLRLITYIGTSRLSGPSHSHRERKQGA